MQHERWEFKYLQTLLKSSRNVWIFFSPAIILCESLQPFYSQTYSFFGSYKNEVWKRAWNRNKKRRNHWMVKLALWISYRNLETEIRIIQTFVQNSRSSVPNMIKQGYLGLLDSGVNLRFWVSQGFFYECQPKLFSELIY